ncbi:arginase family protein [Companilactobacillus baiquanensis]|uniref:Arginase family protein n=1 Tax=Companilactobacillus baiquanensis TaxID=2486005 RepID=A0ABW1USJ5_9LACO|nr:arginase family protein [Companilactobacillus baiquanensis]
MAIWVYHSYYFGAQLLNWLAPQNPQQKSIQVPVVAPQKDQPKLKVESGVTAKSTVLDNVHQAQKIVDAEQPNRIITLGGNCMVSQVPFSYLHDKYGDDVGIIWIDAHPDISNPQIFSNEHAMILANLMGKGDPDLSKLIKHPFSNNSICM